MVGKNEMGRVAGAERRRSTPNTCTGVHYQSLLSDKEVSEARFYPQVSWWSLDPVLFLRERGSQHPALWLQA